MQTYQCPTCGAVLPPDGFCPKDGARAQGAAFGAGSQLDKYVVESKLGEGGMGEVWRGRHTVVNKKVAIKLLSARYIDNKEIVLRFRREASAVNEIRNKHLIDIFDFGELPDGRPYFVMEFLEGKSLARYLEERGPIPFSELLPLFEQLCRAMQAAHDHGIVHRDLKPDNIFLLLEDNAKPFVKVLDFGIAKLAHSEEGVNITKTGSVFGTPAYMSPEQCEGTKAVDHRSDIYAMGIILCEMICGRTPFAEPGEGTGVIMAKHIMTPAPPPSRLVSGRSLSAAIDAMVLRALSKDPGQRQQRAMALYEDLVAATKELSEAPLSSAKPVHMPATTAQPSTRPGDYYAGANTKPPVKRGPSSALMVGAALSVVFGVGIAYVSFGDSTPTNIPATPTPAPSTTPVPILDETPAKPKTIHLSVNASEKASVMLENVFLGETPLEVDIPYSEKEALLKIQREGFESKELPFTPRADLATVVELKSLAKNNKTKTSKEKDPPKKSGKTLLFND
jgi:serine/threonine protein kinase